jgi:hypothetical protein
LPLKPGLCAGLIFCGSPALNRSPIEKLKLKLNILFIKSIFQTQILLSLSNNQYLYPDEEIARIFALCTVFTIHRLLKR